MILVQSMKCWYLAKDKQHHLLGLSKSQIEAAYAANVNDANLGNYLTNKYSFLEYSAEKYSHSTSLSELEIERRFARDINHVHHKLEADIRANQIDAATDEETFNEVIAWPLVKDALEQIAPPEVEIALDLRA